MWRILITLMKVNFDFLGAVGINFIIVPLRVHRPDRKSLTEIKKTNEYIYLIYILLEQINSIRWNSCKKVKEEMISWKQLPLTELQKVSKE